MLQGFRHFGLRAHGQRQGAKQFVSQQSVAAHNSALVPPESIDSIQRHLISPITHHFLLALMQSSRHWWQNTWLREAQQQGQHINQ